MTATTALLSAAMLSWAYPVVPVAAPFVPPAPAPITAGSTPEAAPDAAPEAPPGPAPAATPPAPAPESPAAALQGAPPGANPTHIPGEATPPPAGRKRKNKRRDAQDATPPGDDDDGRFGNFEIKGRIFVLGEWQRVNVAVVTAGDSGATAAPVVERDAFDISVASVRPSLRWQAPQKWLSAVVEFELTRKPDLRDGFMQAKNKHLLLRAGQFKMPGSAIETASPWTLPFVRRGLLHTLLVDGLDSPWRRPGVMLRWRGAGALRLELSGAIIRAWW